MHSEISNEPFAGTLEKLYVVQGRAVQEVGNVLMQLGVEVLEDILGVSALGSLPDVLVVVHCCFDKVLVYGFAFEEFEETLDSFLKNCQIHISGYLKSNTKSTVILFQ